MSCRHARCVPPSSFVCEQQGSSSFALTYNPRSGLLDIAPNVEDVLRDLQAMMSDEVHSTCRRGAEVRQNGLLDCVFRPFEIPGGIKKVYPDDDKTTEVKLRGAMTVGEGAALILYSIQQGKPHSIKGV